MSSESYFDYISLDRKTKANIISFIDGKTRCALEQVCKVIRYDVYSVYFDELPVQIQNAYRTCDPDESASVLSEKYNDDITIEGKSVTLAYLAKAAGDVGLPIPTNLIGKDDVSKIWNPVDRVRPIIPHYVNLCISPFVAGLSRNELQRIRKWWIAIELTRNPMLSVLEPIKSRYVDRFGNYDEHNHHLGNHSNTSNNKRNSVQILTKCSICLDYTMIQGRRKECPHLLLCDECAETMVFKQEDLENVWKFSPSQIDACFPYLDTVVLQYPQPTPPLQLLQVPGQQQYGLMQSLLHDEDMEFMSPSPSNSHRQTNIRVYMFWDLIPIRLLSPLYIPRGAHYLKNVPAREYVEPLPRNSSVFGKLHNAPQRKKRLFGAAKASVMAAEERQKKKQYLKPQLQLRLSNGNNMNNNIANANTPSINISSQNNPFDIAPLTLNSTPSSPIHAALDTSLSNVGHVAAISNAGVLHKNIPDLSLSPNSSFCIVPRPCKLLQSKIDTYRALPLMIYRRYVQCHCGYKAQCPESHTHWEEDASIWPKGTCLKKVEKALLKAHELHALIEICEYEELDSSSPLSPVGSPKANMKPNSSSPYISQLFPVHCQLCLPESHDPLVSTNNIHLPKFHPLTNEYVHGEQCCVESQLPTRLAIGAGLLRIRQHENIEESIALCNNDTEGSCINLRSGANTTTGACGIVQSLFIKSDAIMAYSKGLSAARLHSQFSDDDEDFDISPILTPQNNIRSLSNPATPLFDPLKQLKLMPSLLNTDEICEEKTETV